MLFAIICTDKPSSLETRKSNREAHLAFLSELGDRLKAGGPFLDESGSPSGSLLIIEAASASEAHATVEKDPYALAGLFQSVDIQQWKKVFWQAEI